jgi:prevent-host-death family protein
MPNPIRVRNARGELIEPTKVSASDAKNRFGRILERVARDGGVTITRRQEPFAVVIPVEAYARLAGAEGGDVNTLSAEFDALLERMQAPGTAEAMQRAFSMAPKELGRAALQAAAGHAVPRRTKAAPSGKRAAKKRAKRG